MKRGEHGEVKQRSYHFLLLMSLLLVTLPLGLAGCAKSDANQGASGIDLAFSTEMVSHHEMAVQMAAAAQSNASRAELRELAKRITQTQTGEISQLRASEQRLGAAGVKPKSLGLSPGEMGMDMDMDMMRKREGFDRMFIDMMILHHQGAIRMARVVLKSGGDPDLRAMARKIVMDQSREIEQMNRWHKEWYGTQSPSGGVPAEGEAPESSNHVHG